MTLNFKINSKNYSINSDSAIDISISQTFNENQPNAYNVEKASTKYYQEENFIGDTRKGGSCNFDMIKLIPHCNGTHTECVGHISYERIHIHPILTNCFIRATLISVNTINSSKTNETYIPPKNNDDFLITKSSLEPLLKNINPNFLEALIIRTLPNDDSKKNRNYMDEPPAFFSIEAISYISSLNVNHLLIDTPSIDRTFDEGKLTSHHIFWNVEKESHDVDKTNHSLKTITEMIYVQNSVADGNYILNLQIPPFLIDAAPSRPIIFPVINY